MDRTNYIIELGKELYGHDVKVIFLTLEMSQSSFSGRFEKYLKGKFDGKDCAKVGRIYS